MDGAIGNRLVIRRRDSGSSSWTTVTSLFTMNIDDADPSIVTLTYTGTNPSHLGKNIEYEITPGTSSLRCLGVPNEPNVESFTYLFAIYFDCQEALEGVFDINGDGVVDYVDLRRG